MKPYASLVPDMREEFGSRLTSRIVASHFARIGETTFDPDGVRLVLGDNYRFDTDYVQAEV